MAMSIYIFCFRKSGWMFARQTVEFSVKGPVSLILDEEQITLPGSAILDINFTRPSQVSGY